MSKPAFPRPMSCDPEDYRNPEYYCGQTGMTMLEYASLEILKGLMLRHKEDGYEDDAAISESVRLANRWIERIEIEKK
ncbi:MAG: hypothetical protein GY861_03870 [bacterium]|nr:hypothetical protein [bacterium]